MGNVLVFAISMVVAMLWMGVFAPMIARFFGVPLAMGFWRLDRKNQHLSRRAYVWAFGALSLGLGLFLFSVVHDALTGVVNPVLPFKLSLGQVLLRLGVAVAILVISCAVLGPEEKNA